MRLLAFAIPFELSKENPKSEKVIIRTDRVVKIETIEVFTDVKRKKIGIWRLSKYPYSIAIKENGITRGIIDCLTEGALSGYKVDFAEPLRLSGEISLLATANINEEKPFNLMIHISMVEI